ncbi:helix-turn-helix domain-containing protein [Flagellimonas sp. GZD32]|uniref:helix-turn-helix domain-containing protein n=1 Tax=Flagellimonas cixiensis TaxID=3228750 RepID=UPI0035C91338
MRIKLTADDQKLIDRVAERVKQFRNELGISQDELALRADTTKSQIYRIEHGQLNSSIATLGRLAKALGVEVKDLFLN